MSDTPQTPLGGAVFEGIATIRELGPWGMITLRASCEACPGLGAAIKEVTGCALPEPRRIVQGKSGKAAAWMSPDEYLLLMERADVSGALSALSQALEGQHHLAVDVSDARAVFQIEGDKADQVMRKISPVDFDLLPVEELRRSRAGQVAAAFWRAQSGAYTLITFRSTALYVMELLSHSAAAGSALR